MIKERAVCKIFIWSFPSYSRVFHSYGDVIITCEGLQIFTYSRHWWSLSSEWKIECFKIQNINMNSHKSNKHIYNCLSHSFLLVSSVFLHYLFIKGEGTGQLQAPHSTLRHLDVPIHINRYCKIISVHVILNSSSLSVYILTSSVR